MRQYVCISPAHNAHTTCINKSFYILYYDLTGGLLSYDFIGKVHAS